jgi:hypothetical protein
MRQPPLKAIEAVLLNRVDHRTRRLVTHFRNYFRCFDRDGKDTDDENEVSRVELTQRGVEYWKQNNGSARRRIPESAPTF